VEIVRVDGLFDNGVAEIVGGAEDEPRLHAQCGSPLALGRPLSRS
jgi:hypothetical protein